MSRRTSAVLAAAIVAVCAGARPSAQIFDPALRFRQLPTEHFVIYFHQGEDPLAHRLARIAEETWHALERPLGIAPPRQTRIVLADQTELYNGYATPVPYNTVVLYAVTPSGSDSDFEDWLRLVFTHEFTHIIHLDRSQGWARVVRGIFGRTPYAFPNLFLPPWQVEGLATYEESAITGDGRLHAGDFRAIVGEAARQHRLEPLDRVNGGLTDWPGGLSVYGYGAAFHQYLAERFGADSLATLADATSRRLPYIASPAFKHVYGEPLGDLWREFEASLTADVTAPPAPPRPITQLTRQGFTISGPRFDRFACAGCPGEIVYSAVNPDGFPAIYRVGLAGGEPRRLTTRYLGSTIGIGREQIYFDQVEVRRNTGLYGDLYALTRADGRVHQLTFDARLLDPDLSPDGETLICVQNRPGQRDLVLVRLKPDTTETTTARAPVAPVVSGFSRTDTTRTAGGQAVRPVVTTLIAEAGTQFDAPKWSPDGRTIAVERHRAGAMPEIVLVDVATSAAVVLAAEPRTRFVTPAWRPDGHAVVAAAAPGDETFNLVELPLDGSASRSLTHAAGGALWPDVSPDGKTIVYVGYTTAGYDLFSTPYPSADANALRVPAHATAAANPPLRAEHAPPLPDADYSPRETLAPTSWTPVIDTGNDQLRVGAAVSGVAVLGYHAYAGSATWLVSSPDGAPTPGAATPDWQVYYLYDRWRPTLYVSATNETLFFAGPATGTGSPIQSTRRERQIEGGVIVPMLHVRAQHTARLSIARAVSDYTSSDGSFTRNRVPVRAAWETLTAHTYGYSISREHGLAAGATVELVRQSLGSSANATTTTVDARAYLPGLAAHHVIALRLGGGRSLGDVTVGRTFLLGGDSPGAGVSDLGASAFSLLRGFSSNTFPGSHVAIANAEYRWPLARPQRGHGTWPLFLHTVHAALFADAGHAWTQTFEAAAIKSSLGAQLSADLVAGFFAPFTVSAGAAWGHDGSGLVSDRVTAYFRVGKGF